MKNYSKNIPAAFSVTGSSEKLSAGTRQKTEEKVILWSVSILSWAFFLAGAAVSILRIYYPGCI